MFRETDNYFVFTEKRETTKIAHEVSCLSCSLNAFILVRHALSVHNRIYSLCKRSFSSSPHLNPSSTRLSTQILVETSLSVQKAPVCLRKERMMNQQQRAFIFCMEKEYLIATATLLGYSLSLSCL